MAKKISKHPNPNSRMRLILAAALAVALVLASVGISTTTHGANSPVVQVLKRINPIALAHHIFAV